MLLYLGYSSQIDIQLLKDLLMAREASCIC